jgi:cytidylate kinase
VKEETMIRLVTIEREYGSGGAEIARMVADRLGWRLWDHLLTEEIARIMGCPCQTVEGREEKRDSLQYRLFKAFMMGSFEGTLNAPRLKMVDADHIRRAAKRVVLSAAEEGNAVIVGRGSAYYLRDRPDAFHVFVYASFEEKVRRLQARGKTESEALELTETVDRDRAEYIKKYFDVDWPTRDFFHLMINTGLGDDIAVETILHSVSILERQPA